MAVPYSKSLSKQEEERIRLGLINPFAELRTDICPFCKSPRVELISFNGYPQHYKDAVRDHLQGYDIDYDKWEIRAMKCQACGKEFTIDWTFGFPIPLTNSYAVSRFFKEFAEGI